MARREIDAYMKTQQQFADELLGVGLKAGFPVFGSLVTGAGAHFLQQIYGITSWAATLTIAAGTVLSTVASFGPDAVKVWRQHQNVKVNAGKAFMSPYCGITL